MASMLLWACKLFSPPEATTWTVKVIRSLFIRLVIDLPSESSTGLTSKVLKGSGTILSFIAPTSFG